MKQFAIPRAGKASKQAQPAKVNEWLYKQLEPQNLVLYADSAVVAINKPRGLVCQPSRFMAPDVDDKNKDTMGFALKGIKEALHLDEDLRTVHRLDKQTTGLLYLARTMRSAKELSRQIRDRTLQKTYLALVYGQESDFPASSGVMDTKIVSEEGYVRVVDGAHNQPSRALSNTSSGENWVKQAITEYRVLATSPKVPITLLELNLVTGVKHQIRAQLAQCLGTPILSDLYGSREQTQEIARALDLERSPPLCLHSSRLTYTRYARTGPKRMLRLGVGAPIPSAFDRVCKAAQIELDVDQRSGGVWVDDEKVRGVGTELYRKQKGGITKDDIDDTVTSIGGVWYGSQ